MAAQTRDPKPQPRLVDQHKRVVLPKDVLDSLGLDSGDYVVFGVEGDKAWIKKVKWSA